MNIVENLMLEFAEDTGLSSNRHPKRYLWTDAYAVCNFIQLYKQTDKDSYKQLAIDLVDQVHNILGKHRKDDSREGWLSTKEHPTRQGLRIGKERPERKPYQVLDQDLEWERDGQYFHYLTKWMIALIKMGNLLENNEFYLWAADLVEASTAFIHDDRMYWKMSIDLSRPLITSMGQHDPLNGYTTYKMVNKYVDKDLGEDIKHMSKLSNSIQLPTTDPLGLGELLIDAYRLSQMKEDKDLISKIINAAEFGLTSYNNNYHTLAFRELGLAIGLNAAMRMEKSVTRWELKQHIIDYWLHNRDWKEHREINRVMLATSLEPDEFLKV